jgi:hypothetical protein
VQFQLSVTFITREFLSKEFGWCPAYDKVVGSVPFVKCLKEKAVEVKLDVACSRHAREEKYLQSLSGKPEETTPVGRHRHKSVNNIKMYH